VLTLAFGIGANTAMFTVVESVLLRPLPYAHANRLVRIGSPDGPALASTSWLNFRDIRDQSRALAAVGCYNEDVGVLCGKEGSVTVVSPGLTPGLLEILGAKPLLGRTFLEAEGQPGGPKAIILSENLWRNTLHSDPAIIGQTVGVNGQAHTVVGVMPNSFRFPE